MPGRTKSKKEDVPVEDTAMEDAPPSAQPEDGNDEDVEEEEEEEVEPQRVKIVRLSPLNKTGIHRSLDCSCPAQQIPRPHLSSSTRATRLETH